jgi:hypothetical protein
MEADEFAVSIEDFVSFFPKRAALPRAAGFGVTDAGG